MKANFLSRRGHDDHWGFTVAGVIIYALLAFGWARIVWTVGRKLGL